MVSRCTIHGEQSASATASHDATTTAYWLVNTDNGSYRRLDLGEAVADELVEKLEIHYLANQGSQLYFALLTDFADARAGEAPNDGALLADLPESIDPCGERGEFHSFAYRGPMFAHPIAIETGVVVERDGFVFADLLPAITHNAETQRAQGQ